MRAIAILALVLLLSSSVTAIGVSPARAHIKFTPGGSGEFDVMIMNTLSRDINVGTRSEGDLAEHFTATVSPIKARANGVATIRYELPDDITPGKHVQQIAFTEVFTDESEGSLPVRTEVKLRVEVFKPYPGKYGELHLYPEHVPEGKNTNVRIRLLSRGTEALSGDLEIEIVSAEGELTDKFFIRDLFVAGDSHIERVSEIMSANFPPGKYSVDATYDYGAGVVTKSEPLIIGTKSVEILDLTSDYYLDQSPNRFVVEIESMWNEPMPNVEGSITLGKRTGRTPTVTLPPFGKKTLVGYWETDTELAPGEYSALVTATFGDGDQKTKTFPVTLHNETPQPEPQEPAEDVVLLGLTDILFIVVILCVVTYFMVLAWKRHHRHGQ